MRIALPLMLLSLPLVAVAKDGTRLSLSVYEATGHYGSPVRTTIQSVALGLRHRTGHWTLRASIPWLYSVVRPTSCLTERPPRGARHAVRAEAWET